MKVLTQLLPIWLVMGVLGFFAGIGAVTFATGRFDGGYSFRQSDFPCMEDEFLAFSTTDPDATQCYNHEDFRLVFDD